MSAPLSILALASSTVEVRRATLIDLGATVDLLSDDPMGKSREIVTAGDEDLGPYRRVLKTLDADPAHLLLVAADGNGVVGTMQLPFISGSPRRGALRAQIDALHVHESYRSHGLGTAMFQWAIAEARRRGCALVQLTTDKTRGDAHRFYDRLGYTASHEGFKLQP